MDIRDYSLKIILIWVLVFGIDPNFGPNLRAEPDPSTDPAPAISPSVARDSQWIDLYFGHANGRNLGVEARRLMLPSDPAQEARAIVKSWIEGPRRKHLMPVIPRETKIRGIYIASSGIAYVDIEPTKLNDFPGGCHTELLAIYGLVNSLVLNIPQVSAVKILLAGQEAVTLAGHILLTEPFKADLLLVR